MIGLAANRELLITVVVCAAAIAPARPLYAEPPREQKKEAQLLLDQALEHGRGWRQGVVEIKIQRRSPRQVKRIEFLAFDHDAGLIRFDAEETERWDGTEWACKCITSPDETIRWTGDHFMPTLVHRHLPGQAPRIVNAEPFELNGIAVADAVTVINHFDFDRLKWFYKEHFKFNPEFVTAYRRDGSKIIAIWELPAINEEGSPHRREFIFDLSSGGLPIHVKSELYDKKSDIWANTGETNISWHAVKETFLPVKWDSRLHLRSRDEMLQYELTMTFDWKSLNEELPKNLFTLENFAIDPRTMVVNKKLGASIIEGTMQEVLHPPNDRARLEIGGGARYWLVAVNAVLLALIIAIVVWRYRRSLVR